MAWIDLLQNAQLKSSTSQALTDNSFTYTEVLALLQDAAKGGITSTEFSDLSSIYKNSVNFFSNDYVKSITYNVILGNTANSTWWGGAKGISDTSVLGDMSAGSSQLHAERLIGKWFLGLDLPMPLVGGDTANAEAASGIYDYRESTGSLFVNGVAATDIAQGSVGTCYLLAALGAIAHSSPQSIRDSIIDNGNGSYGVRVFVNEQLIYTTVNQSLMVKPYSNQVVAAHDTGNGASLGGELWVSLLEKAYAQLNSQVNIVERQPSQWNQENSYQAIEGGGGSPLRQFTDLGYDKYALVNYYNPAGKTYVSSSPSTYKAQIIEALSQGAIGSLASYKTLYNSSGQMTLIGGHGHMVLGYNTETDKFIIRNPWGGPESNSKVVKQFELGIEEFWNKQVNPILMLTTSKPTANFNYTIASNSSNVGGAVNEGEVVVITVTRDKSGSESAVYFDMTPGTAGEDDYESYGRFSIRFEAHETTKNVGLRTKKDSLSEGTESYNLNLYKTTNAITPNETLSLFIKDIASTRFEYTINSSASSANQAVVEGGNVTFTITRSGSGSESTVYLTTGTDTASTSDYSSLDTRPLTFAAYETTKKIDIRALTDSNSEQAEKFVLSVAENPGDATFISSATAYIKDPQVPYFDYTVTSSAGSPETAVGEGSPITFTITRSGVGLESTVYINTENVTASSQDYAGLSLRPVIFSKNQKIVTIEVETNEDQWLDVTEYFNLNVFRNEVDKIPLSYGSGYLKESTTTFYDYTITNDSSEINPTPEGKGITFTIERSDSGTVSTVYVKTDNVTATADDFNELVLQTIDFAAHETVKTITIETKTDSVNEGDEVFELELFRNQADQHPTAYSTAYIANKVVEKDYTYKITNSSSENSSVDEGQDIVFKIARDGSGSTSTVYLSTVDGTAEDSGDGIDYSAIKNYPLIFSSFETEKIITIKTYSDSTAESEEYFWLNLYATVEDASEQNYLTYAKGIIGNTTSASDFNYSITSNSTFESPLDEGGKIVFTVTRSGTGAASTVYLSTSDGDASSAGEGIDYEPLDKIELTFADYETTKTVSVTTYTDFNDENKEYFNLDLYKTYADAESGDYTAYASAYIKNAAAEADYSYTISSSADRDNPASEDEHITFTVTRSGSGTASSVYLKTISGTATSEGTAQDYRGITKNLTFESYETTKKIRVETWADSLEEGNEYFYIELYKTYKDLKAGDAHSYASGGIQDWAGGTDYAYTITSSGTIQNPTKEGDQVTFEVNRSGSGTASTVYVKTHPGVTSETDYEPIDLVAIDFAAFETTKTVTVTTLNDAEFEGPEHFYLLLFKSYSDYGSWVDGDGSKLGSWREALITDAQESDPYSYDLTSSNDANNPVAEGGLITFTLTRDGSGTASSVYVLSSGGTTEKDGVDKDYVKLLMEVLTFTKDETSKTFEIETLTDSKTEDPEYFYVTAFKTWANVVAGKYDAWTTGGIKDGNKDENLYSYSVVSSSTLEDPAEEGATISFTITRDNTSGASTVYVATTPGTAAASDSDYKALPRTPVNFLDGESSKTITVETLKDKVADGDADSPTGKEEYFFFLLFKNLSDAEAGKYDSYTAAVIRDLAEEKDYNYTVTSDYSLENPAEEGSSITFTIIRDASDTPSTIYVSTNPGTAKGSLGDFEILKEKAVNFASGETEKTVTVNTYVDEESEDSEYFHLLLYKTQADATDSNYASYAAAGIKDQTETKEYDYTLTSDSPSNNQVQEGGSITFTITRSDSGTASTVFVSTNAASATEDDYKALKNFPVNFLSDQTEATVTVETLIDTIDESQKPEYFHLLLYKNLSDSKEFNYATARTGYIRDNFVGNDYDYTITADTPSVYEGDQAYFTITRSDSGTPSIVYVRTRYNTADSDDGDYQAQDLEIYFAADELTKTVTVQTLSDTKAESDEYFNINLYKTVADKEVYNWAAYSGAWIKNKDPGYSIAAFSEDYPDGAKLVKGVLYAEMPEGGRLAVTLSRTPSDSEATIYLYGASSTAKFGEDLDFSKTTASKMIPVTFEPGVISKTIYVDAFNDTANENTEAAPLLLYDSTEAGTLPINFFVIYIVDKTPATSSASLSFSSLITDSNFVTDGNVLGENKSDEITDNFNLLHTSGNSFYGHDQGTFKNDYAFSAVTNEGKVIAWGDSAKGGDISNISTQLINIVRVYSNSNAFAAIKADGSVIAWGDPDSGGNISSIESSLNGSVSVQEIFSTKLAFAALRSDGSVITWGDNSTGGDSQAVKDQLDGNNAVLKIISNMSAFAAIHADGSVTTWGFSEFGGDSQSKSATLNGAIDVVEVSSTGSAFAALKDDGSVTTWGNPLDGGDSSKVATQIAGSLDVLSIHSTTSAFAAIRTDGSVITWGDQNNGGNSLDVIASLDGSIDIKTINATDSAFAALLQDGSVVTWGNSDYGGNSQGVSEDLNGTIKVTQIISNRTSFSALREDGSVVSWGYGPYGGTLGALASQLNEDVVSITANDNAFAAIKADGSVVTWGGFQRGGDSSSVSTKINGSVDVIKIFPTSTAFSALRADGTVVSWGDWRRGGDSTSITNEQSAIASLSTIEKSQKPTVTIASVPSFYGEATDSFTNTTGKISASDLDGDSLLFSIVGGISTSKESVFEGTYGTLQLDSRSGEWKYLPGENFRDILGNASETFQLNVSDGVSSATSAFKVDISVGRKGNGTSGDDFILMNGENTNLDGGSGVDTALYPDVKDKYSLTISDGVVTVNDTDGVDVFKNIERVQFSDSNLALDLDGNAGNTARFLGVLLGSESVLNPTYVGIVISFLDSGTSYYDLMQIGLDAVLGAGASGASVVNLIYKNLVGTNAPESLLADYAPLIDGGSMSAVDLAIAAGNHPINDTNIDLVGLSQTGLEYFLI